MVNANLNHLANNIAAHTWRVQPERYRCEALGKRRRSDLPLSKNASLQYLRSSWRSRKASR